MSMIYFLEYLKLGQKLCCEAIPNYEITYENNETWLVCKSCFKSKPWNRFIKSKVEIDLKKI